MSDQLPVVVGLGAVAPGLVTPTLGPGIRFVEQPGDDDIAVAEGAIARADAVLDADFLARAPRLRVIARTGVGTEKVDLTAASARGIAVVVTPGAGTTAVAEGAIAMAMHLVKRFGPLSSLVREGRWAERGGITVGDLGGAVLGVVGFGRIGRRAAALGEGLGMRTLAYDPVADPPADVRCTTLEELFERSDVITLHLPQTPQTMGLVGRELLKRARRGTILVNCGRGGLIDIDAVHEALLDGTLGGVGFDVFEPEPPTHHPLFDHPDVVLTPHLMGLSRNATAATFTEAAQGVVDVLAGRRPVAVANPDWHTALAVSEGSR